MASIAQTKTKNCIDKVIACYEYLNLYADLARANVCNCNKNDLRKTFSFENVRFFGVGWLLYNCVFLLFTDHSHLCFLLFLCYMQYSSSRAEMEGGKDEELETTKEGGRERKRRQRKMRVGRQMRETGEKAGIGVNEGAMAR